MAENCFKKQLTAVSPLHPELLLQCPEILLGVNTSSHDSGP